jgi:hypothetical protein
LVVHVTPKVANLNGPGKPPSSSFYSSQKRRDEDEDGEKDQISRRRSETPGEIPHCHGHGKESLRGEADLGLQLELRPLCKNQGGFSHLDLDLYSYRDNIFIAALPSSPTCRSPLIR